MQEIWIFQKYKSQGSAKSKIIPAGQIVAATQNPFLQKMSVPLAPSSWSKKVFENFENIWKNSKKRKFWTHLWKFIAKFPPVKISWKPVYTFSKLVCWLLWNKIDGHLYRCWDIGCQSWLHTVLLESLNKKCHKWKTDNSILY